MYPDERRNNRIIFRKARYSPDDTKDLRHLLKSLSYNLGSASRTKNNYQNNFGFVRIYDPSGKKQPCMVKMRYSKKLASHKKFLEQYMPQKEKSEVLEKPIIFGTDDYKDRMAPNHFKFVLSPESDKIPMEHFVKAWIEKTELETGYKLDWQAAIHQDTGHPHAHVLINGVDLKGKKIRFDRDFIKRRSHVIASDICTAMIGERTPEQIAESYDRSFSAQRWTSHDEKMVAILGSKFDSNMSQEINPVTEDLKKRLSALAEMKLAEYMPETKTYLLQKHWDNSLRSVGRYNSFLSVRNELMWTLPDNMELYTDQTGTVSGTVRKLICMNDEDIWNNALVIENKEQHKAWYIPMFNPPSKKFEGKNITVSMHRNSKGLLVPDITFNNATQTTSFADVSYR